MIHRLRHLVKQLVAEMIGTMPQPRWGTVISFDPSRPALKAIMHPDEVPSGWLPVAQSSAGGGGTVLSPILPGMQVLLVPELGSPGHDFVAVGFAHSDAAQPPKVANTNGVSGVQQAATVAWSGDEWMVVANGSVVRLTTAGDIFLQPFSGTVKVDGNLAVNGNITATLGITAGAGGADQVTVQGHSHPQGDDGHGDNEVPTGPPTPGT